MDQMTKQIIMLWAPLIIMIMCLWLTHGVGKYKLDTCEYIGKQCDAVTESLKVLKEQLKVTDDLCSKYFIKSHQLYELADTEHRKVKELSEELERRIAKVEKLSRHLEAMIKDMEDC